MYARTRMPSSQGETRRRQACGQPRGCPAAVTEDGDVHHGGVREVSSVVCVLRRQRARSFGRVVALYSRRSRRCSRGDFFLVGTSQEESLKACPRGHTKNRSSQSWLCSQLVFIITIVSIYSRSAGGNNDTFARAGSNPNPSRVCPLLPFHRPCSRSEKLCTTVWPRTLTWGSATWTR